MGIQDLTYRTRTYLAGDWDNDYDVVAQLRKWNDGDKWTLSFSDIYEITQSRDTSLNCSIKSSLSERMKYCKNFVLVVGEHTKSLRSGACSWCPYSFYSVDEGRSLCSKGRLYDSRSYVQYECERAADLYQQGKLNIIVLYKSTRVDKTKCPEILRNKGIHIPAYVCRDGEKSWNYNEIKNAMMG